MIDLNTINAMRDRAVELLKASHYGKFPETIEQLRNVPLTINYRTRTRGGSCKWNRLPYTRHATNVRVEIGHHFATRAPIKELENCVTHELAHAFHVLMTHDSDHGVMWQAIHRAMGGNAERCHSVDVKKNRVQRHIVKDLSTGRIYKAVSTRTWNRIKNAKIFNASEGNFSIAYELLGVYYKGDPVPAVA